MTRTTGSGITSRLFFGLLPLQVLLIAMPAANSLISGIFAGNFVGDNALSAMGLYNPLNLFVTAVGTILLCGAQILCGRFLGAHETDKVKSVFSLDLTLAFAAGVVLTAVFLIGGLADATGVVAGSEELRPFFNQYLIGQAIGIIPLLLSQQLFAFMSLEQQNKRNIIASAASVFATVVFSYLFVGVFRMGVFGVALAAALSNWVFLAFLLSYYLSGRSIVKFHYSRANFRYFKEMVHIGLPGALQWIYQMGRGFIVNGLILIYVGSDGLSAFAASNAFLGIVWSIPMGIQATTRVMFGMSWGEEDRKALTDTMRTVVYKCIPMMCVIAGIVIALAVPLTQLFTKDNIAPSIYRMTVEAFRLLPLCMPFSVFALSYDSYGQTAGKQLIVHIDTIFDGVISVVTFTAILIVEMGMRGVYLANILNGVIIVLIYIIYSCIRRKKFPLNMESLMVIPESFGVPDHDVLNISIRQMDDVVRTAEAVQKFCLAHGVEDKKAYLSALCLEEMAGNIVEHGFTKDNKKHAAEVRVVYKDGALILRLKDDCMPFDPAVKYAAPDPEDPAKNVGIRMIYRLVDRIDYQCMMKLNILTLTIR